MLTSRNPLQARTWPTTVTLRPICPLVIFAGSSRGSQASGQITEGRQAGPGAVLEPAHCCHNSLPAGPAALPD